MHTLNHDKNVCKVSEDYHMHVAGDVHTKHALSIHFYIIAARKIYFKTVSSVTDQLQIFASASCEKL